MNKKIMRDCGWCGAEIMRRPFNHNTGKPIAVSFCDNVCKGEWQRANLKPNGIDKAWLVQKYEVDQLDCAEIGRMVGRDTKRVWEWLRDYGIAIRGRGSSVAKQWSRGDRLPHGLPHTVKTRAMLSEIAKADGRVPYMMPDGSHYMKGRRGSDHHGWQGGLTPEREAVAQSQEWKDAVKAVWARADAKCERCGRDHRKVDNRKANGFHVHHIASFSRFAEKRCEVGNLALLCRPCHHFVHSRKNVRMEFIHD